MTKFVVVVFWEFFPKMGVVTGSTQEVSCASSDDRYSRERLCLDLALRFLRHEARIQTIRAGTV
jgi:hypothetical protein